MASFKRQRDRCLKHPTNQNPQTFVAFSQHSACIGHTAAFAPRRLRGAQGQVTTLSQPRQRHAGPRPVTLAKEMSSINPFRYRNGRLRGDPRVPTTKRGGLQLCALWSLDRRIRRSPCCTPRAATATRKRCQADQKSMGQSSLLAPFSSLRYACVCFGRGRRRLTSANRNPRPGYNGKDTHKNGSSSCFRT